MKALDAYLEMMDGSTLAWAACGPRRKASPTRASPARPSSAAAMSA